MTRTASSWLLVAALATTSVLACDARELTVFELPNAAGSSSSAGVYGMAGTPGAGAGGTMAGIGGQAGAAPTSAGAGGSSAGLGGAAGGAAGMAGSAGAAPVPCASPADCLPNWQCEKRSCDAPMGECQPPPSVFCPPEPDPVCGCDGVTYWNDCIRRQTGAQVERMGECSETACACEVGSDCEAPFATCAHLVQGAETCRGGGTGACWVLPPQCMPNQKDAPVWQECHPPDAPPPPCVDTCLAIASERPHARKKPGDECKPP